MISWDSSKMAAFDFETSGKLPEYALQPWRIPAGDAWPTSISVIRFEDGRLQRHLSKLFPTVADVRGFLQTAIAEDWTLVGWNVVFDIMVLLGLGLEDLVARLKFLDTMLLWRHLEIEPEYEFQSARHKKKHYRLKPEGHQRWLPSREGRHEDVDFHSTDPADLAKLQAYNDDDSVDTWLIGKMAWESLSDTQLRAALIEAQSLPMIAQANFIGMEIDELVCDELSAKLIKTADEMLKDLAPHGITEKIVRSPKQLGEVLFDQWLMPVLKENKSKDPLKPNTRSTDKEVLHELSFRDERCRKVKTYREALNTNGKFIKAILTSVEYNGDARTRPAGIPFGTYSGRMTYASKQGKGVDERPTGWALHQMKREKMYRAMVIAPEGFDLVELDAAGQEYRWMAIASSDPTMLGLCQPGEDAHSFMGAQIVGCDYHDLIRRFAAEDAQAINDRYLGKFGNLSCQYRIGDKKLRSKARVDYDIPLEMPAAARINKTFKNSYRSVPVYWGQQIFDTKRTGYVETFAGRRVSVVGNWSGEWGWAMGSTAINYRIQGTGADQKYLAMMVLRDYVHSIGGYFAWDLHDGLFWYIPSEKTASAVDIMKRMLDNLPYRQAWGFSAPIPLPWDAKVGKSWGTMKEWRSG